MTDWKLASSTVSCEIYSGRKNIMTNLLNITNLSKHYEGFDLRDVSLRVPAGSIVGLIGSNGAGKTTTIKAALGLMRPDDGTIDMLGERIFPHADEERIAQLKQQIGIVFDTCSLPEELTIEDAGNLMARIYENWDEHAFSNLLATLEMPADKAIKDLSRGMGMKLSIACALAHHPRLLILDEATAGLDPLARDQTLDVLRAFMEDEQHGILMSTHITSDLEKLADYLVCIDNGRIVFETEKDAVCNQAGVAHCRTSEFEAIVASDLFPEGSLRFQRNPYGIDVLVPDRFAFAKQFDRIAVERIDIDTYLTLTLKGEAR